MESKVKKATTFLVSLEGLNLTKDQEKRIEKGIGEIILKEIAMLDNKTDVAITQKFSLHPTWKELWERGQVAGFWIKGYPDFPPGGPNRPY